MIDHQHDCLLIIDVQNDFCPGGTLAVTAGDEVVPIINSIGKHFRHKLLTQDWHPAQHSSFASSHPDAQPFTTVELDYGTQVLWPDHCVQGSPGAEFHSNLETQDCELIIRKGFRQHIDSYSAFYENDHKTSTGLSGYLRSRGFKRIFMAGLATDYCVAYSALDGRQEGFEVVLIDDACRAIDLDDSLAKAHQQFDQSGVMSVNSQHL